LRCQTTKRVERAICNLQKKDLFSLFIERERESAEEEKVESVKVKKRNYTLSYNVISLSNSYYLEVGKPPKENMPNPLNVQLGGLVRELKLMKK